MGTQVDVVKVTDCAEAPPAAENIAPKTASVTACFLKLLLENMSGLLVGMRPGCGASPGVAARDDGRSVAWADCTDWAGRDATPH
jgi:hypothetical protein